MIVGSLDYVAHSLVGGWAVDLSSPENKVNITISFDGRDVWRGFADQLGGDFVSTDSGDGHHAFLATIPSNAVGPSQESVLVRAYVTITSQDLQQSPANLTILSSEPLDLRWNASKRATRQQDPSSIKSEQFANSPASSQLSTDKRAFSGCLDLVNEFQISGWAYHPDGAGPSVSIDIFDGPVFLQRVDADLFREDLADAGYGNGNCSFAFTTPIRLLDGKKHNIRALVTNTQFELPPSPVVLQTSSTISAQIVTQTRGIVQQSLNVMSNLLKILDDGLPARLAKDQAVLSNYQIWCRRFSTISGEDRSLMLAETLMMKDKPSFSIIMPTYRTPRKLLIEAIQSIENQLYPYWVLCIADDASDKETTDLLATLAARDDRIRIRYRNVNGQISQATNTALEMADGDYICFMDHDDLLTEDALFQVAKEINANSPEIVYSDEDKIDERNNFIDPHFKPDFNYSLLLSYNYMCHFLVIKAGVIEKVGRFDSRYNGSQDHDYVLRCCEVVDKSKISHIPLVLYHWRVHENSTASNIGTKFYALEAGVKAITDHLHRTGRKGEVSLGLGNSYRVTWQLPERAPKVSVIIPTRDKADVLAICLIGLLSKTDYKELEIVIVDNNSNEQATADLFSQLMGYPNVKVIRFAGPFNYSQICNYGVEHASGELILFLNNDIEIIRSDWLGEMVGEILQPGVGAVGAKLLYPDGRIQHAGVILGIGGIAGHAHKLFDQNDYGYMNRLNIVQELSACTGACLLVKRDLFNLVGGFNEEQLPVAFNDIDLCLKIVSAGQKIVFCPHAVLRHHESLSRGLENTPAKLVRASSEARYMRETWSKILARDPHYSRNLTLVHEDFSIDPTRGTSRLSL